MPKTRHRVSSKLYINLKKGEQFEVFAHDNAAWHIRTAVVTVDSVVKCHTNDVKVGRYTIKYQRYQVNADFPPWVKQPFIVDAHQRVEVLGRVKDE